MTIQSTQTLKRITALNESIERFKAQLAPQAATAIGEVSLVIRRDPWSSNNMPREYRHKVGVYVYSDYCHENSAFNARCENKLHTTVRYIGSTTNKFYARFKWHKGNKARGPKDNWTWYEIIPIDEQYRHFAPALEKWLERDFPSTESGQGAAMRKRATRANWDQDYWRELKRFQIWDESTNQRFETHRRYFG